MEVIMKEKFRQFMVGRYGMDQLGQFLLWIGVIIMLLSTFLANAILSAVSFILLILCYIRMFSKDTGRRYGENQKYLVHKEKFLGFFKNFKSRREKNKNYHIYSCPTCKQKIRIPKGKGKICITCPKCHAEFIRKS
jgi:predicted membrane protein